MRALAGFIVKGPLQAVLVITLCTVLSFWKPPLTSLLSYVGAAALGLYSLHAGLAGSLAVLAAAAVATGVLGQVVLHQGVALTVTSLVLWLPVWLAGTVLAATRSLAMAMLLVTGLAMLVVALVFAIFGDPAAWWQQHLQAIVDALTAQPEVQIDTGVLSEFVSQVAPLMTGALAAGLSFAALTCLLVGRWWQSQLVKPGAMRSEFFALRLNQGLSLAGIGIMLLATLDFAVVSSIAIQWALIMMVLFLFVGLAVLHASLANLKAGRGWIIAAYVVMGLLPQALLIVVATGMLDPWLDLRRRTMKSESN